MTARLVDEIANAVLYEGYVLYPYRPSALKNRHRFNFGVVGPREAHEHDSSDAWRVQTECLLRAEPDAELVVRVRFLHLFDSHQPAASWQEASEREIRIACCAGHVVAVTNRQQFTFDADAPGQHSLSGEIAITAEIVGDALFKLRTEVSNLTPVPNRPAAGRLVALKEAFLSTHAILQVASGRGEFVSLLDPPPDLAGAAAACRNTGLWPVLVGEEPDRRSMLASPIILYDYPQIAPESAGDFFDGTEIDEMLALRVMTLTDAEKDEARRADPRVRAVLDRTDALSGDQLMQLHGVLRGLRPVEEPSR